MPAISGVDGLSSNIKWNDIVDALVKVDRTTTAEIEGNRDKMKAKLEAVRSFNTKMLTAQVDLAELRRTSTFQSRTVSSSNDSALGASASSSAVPGVYTLSVLGVASAHEVATANFSSKDSGNGVGDITLHLGNGAATTLNFTNANSSLDGIAQAINDAGIDITATVVNDGSGATPYRLVLRGKTTGNDNEISVSGTGDLSTMFAGMTELSEAADASVKVGSGPSAITITQSSNIFTGIVPGVTLTAKDEANNITLTVGNDASGAVTAVQNFVESFNAALTYLNTNASYDTTTKQGGILLSESDMRNSADAMMRSLFSKVDGLPSSLNAVTALGLGIDRDTGLVTLDKTMLSDQLAANADGVRKVFGNSGTSSNSAISFLSLSDKTDVSAAYAIQITQAATQAVVGATGNLAVSTVITGANNQLQLTINGTALTVTLASGTYTRSRLAEQVQSAINAAVTKPSDKVVAGLNGNALDLRSKMYGSAQALYITGGSANADLMLSTDIAQGLDVAGTIDGHAATGTGQIFQGVTDTTSEGLRLLVTATDVIASATFTARKGIAQTTGEELTGLTSISEGSLTVKENGLQAIVTDMEKQITAADARLELRRQRYTAQFLQMEKLIQGFNSQSNFLTSQINSMNKNNN